MNFVSLVLHGLSAVSVYSDVAFARVLLFSLVLTLVAVVGIVAAVIIRLATVLAIPGWTTTVVGILSIVFLQALILSAAAVFLLLSNRSHASVIPVRIAPDYVTSSNVLFAR
jgi:hypothetical protein